MTEDPISDGLNWYTYCANNPIMFIDPEGLRYRVYDPVAKLLCPLYWGLLHFLRSATAPCKYPVLFSGLPVALLSGELRQQAGFIGLDVDIDYRTLEIAPERFLKGLVAAQLGDGVHHAQRDGVGALRFSNLYVYKWRCACFERITPMIGYIIITAITLLATAWLISRIPCCKKQARDS